MPLLPVHRLTLPILSGVLLLPMLLMHAPAYAHDFFILPERFHTKEAVTAHYRVGHSGEFKPWPHGQGHLEALVLHSPGSTTTLTDMSAKASVTVSPTTAGTHMLTLASKWSTSKLEAERFNRYLEKEGLTAIAKHREQNGTGREEGRERYARRAKTLVQNGDLTSNHVTQPSGLTLDIIPAVNPYALGNGDALPLTVLYHGKPLSGALVKLENLTLAGFGTQKVTTDDKGQAEFPISRTGDWKITVVWGEPAQHSNTEFDTLFASLTFGY